MIERPSRYPDLGLLLLHALPLDGSMWTDQVDFFPGPTFAPTLYGLGDTVEEWANEALQVATSDRLIVVGCSVGGSCALEVAAKAPDRVAALVLIGTKAKHDPEPGFHASALEIIETRGLEYAWNQFWAPLFSDATDQRVVDAAKESALRQNPRDIARGVTAFHSRQSRERVVAEFDNSVVVVTGADDVAPGPNASTELAALAPRGHLHVIPSCGHYVPLEQPDVFRTILNDVAVTQRSPA